MSDVLDKVKAELEGDKVRFDVTEEEIVESISFLDDMAEYFEKKGGNNVKVLHSAIKELAILWAMLFDDETEVRINDR